MKPLDHNFRWLHLADVHFGSGHVNPYRLHKTFESIVYPLIDDSLDLITIGGDWFDSALYVDSIAALIATEVLTDLITLSSKHDVAIRVIRGTYTHDRDQLQVLNAIASRNANVDYKYYDKLSIDVVKDQLRFIYAPDNLPMTSLQVYDWLEENLMDEKADCMLVHGYFEHVLPTVVGTGKHLEAFNGDLMQRYVTKIIAAGHVHQSSVYKDFVYYPGSFDRLCHGDEGDKGCLLFTITPSRTHFVETIPNPQATPHVTIYLTKTDPDEAYAEAIEALKVKLPNPPWGYVRIGGGPERLIVSKMLKNLYSSDITITEVDTSVKDRAGHGQETMHNLDAVFSTYSGEVPTMENLSNLLHKFLLEHDTEYDYSEEDIETALHELVMEV